MSGLGSSEVPRAERLDGDANWSVEEELRFPPANAGERRC